MCSSSTLFAVGAWGPDLYGCSELLFCGHELWGRFLAKAPTCYMVNVSKLWNRDPCMDTLLHKAFSCNKFLYKDRSVARTVCWKDKVFCKDMTIDQCELPWRSVIWILAQTDIKNRKSIYKGQFMINSQPMPSCVPQSESSHSMRFIPTTSTSHCLSITHS